MTPKGRVIAARIRQELDDLRPLLEKVQRGVRAAKLKSEDHDLYLDAVALNIHDFYSGMERILLNGAGAIDGVIPEGSQWHQELLQQMHTSVAGMRCGCLRLFRMSNSPPNPPLFRRGGNSLPFAVRCEAEAPDFRPLTSNDHSSHRTRRR